MTSVKNDEEMRAFGKKLGERLRGGEIIELIGDIGAGKTTLVKGIGVGLAVDDDVQSPSFTISRVYRVRDGLELHHYDFYRLNDAGVMQYELAESTEDSQSITVIEWAETVHDVLPSERCVIRIDYMPDGNGRNVTVTAPPAYDYLTEGVS